MSPARLFHEYVDGAVHTNGIENFWSLLKRGIKGTYVSVEPFHMFRYLDELQRELLAIMLFIASVVSQVYYCPVPGGETVRTLTTASRECCPMGFEEKTISPPGTGGVAASSRPGWSLTPNRL